MGRKVLERVRLGALGALELHELALEHWEHEDVELRAC